MYQLRAHTAGVSVDIVHFTSFSLIFKGWTISNLWF